MKMLKFAAVFCLIVGGNSRSFALNCASTGELQKYYLRYHLSTHSFDSELSKKMFFNMVRFWDPGKMYFLQGDIDALQKQYETNLSQIVTAKSCQGIDDIFNVYAKRVTEVYEKIDQIIDKENFTFTIDEKMNLDRKNLPYPKTLDENLMRWKQRVKFQYLQLKKTIKTDEEIRQKLKHRYNLAKKRQKELTSKEVYESALDSFATALDPHTSYMPPVQMEEFRIASSLSLQGIGALLRYEDGFTYVQSLVPGGVAQKSGLIKPDDRIDAVAQGKGNPNGKEGGGVPVDVIDMDLKDVVKLIRGPKGTEVRLTIRRQEKEIIAPLIRDSIQLEDSAAKLQLYEVETKEKGKLSRILKIAVLDLPSFYMDFDGRQAHKKDFRSSSRDVETLLKKVTTEKIDAVVLDIRLNGGGSLDEAINVSGKFLGSGPMVQTKAATGQPYVSRYEGEAIYTGPLVVIIDRQSASASEILAGAIKDYMRGILLGSKHTFGKGTVQVLNDLSDGDKEGTQGLQAGAGEQLGAVKVTVSKFYRPHGESTQVRGVNSDIVLPNVSDHGEVGEEFYDNPLPWEQVTPAAHKNYNLVSPEIVNTLQKTSLERVSKSKDFKEIQDAISEYEKNKAERYLVSLKEKTKKELAEEEKKQKEAEKKQKDATTSTVDNDAILREAVQIAADYACVLGKTPLGEIVKIRLMK
jgi:carboxyl-terminal processing protease